MALTGTDILMNTSLFRMTFPNWPGLARSQAPVPDEAERCECGHLPGECPCPHACVRQGGDSYYASISVKGS